METMSQGSSKHLREERGEVSLIFILADVNTDMTSKTGRENIIVIKVIIQLLRKHRENQPSVSVLCNG